MVGLVDEGGCWQMDYRSCKEVPGILLQKDSREDKREELKDES